MAVLVDHVGIAVRSLEAAQTFYEQLGLVPGKEEHLAAEGVRVLMLGEGAGRVELLQGTDPHSSLARFVERRGEGLHHVAMRVPDVDAEFTRMQAAGLRLASEAVKIGAGGHRYFFVHPASAGGVLVEIVG